MFPEERQLRNSQTSHCNPLLDNYSISGTATDIEKAIQCVCACVRVCVCVCARARACVCLCVIDPETEEIGREDEVTA